MAKLHILITTLTAKKWLYHLLRRFFESKLAKVITVDNFSMHFFVSVCAVLLLPECYTFEVEA